jgi:hypothetical protein
MASKFVEDRSNDSHNLVNGFSKDTCIARQVHLLNEDSTRTGMKEEILRLAWLLVLMRTQEGSQVSFEWAHKQDLQTCKSSNPNRDTIKGLEETVREVLQRTRDPSGPARDDAAPSVSITLSTGSLSQDHETSEVCINSRLKSAPADHIYQRMYSTLRSLLSRHLWTLESFVFDRCGVVGICSTMK